MSPTAAGFVYAPDDDLREFAGARPGDRVQLAQSGPPWIVVHWAPEHIIIASWPGKLWRVKNVESSSVRQVTRGDKCVSARSVEIVEELPAWVLLGDNGREVAQVIAAAEKLDAGRVAALADACTPEVLAAYSRTWNAWLTAVDPTSTRQGEDHSQTLSIPGSGRGSPVGDGLMLVHDAVWTRAEVVLRYDAFQITDEGDPTLDPAWRAAAKALACAAMAFGAPALPTAADQRLLAAPWRAVFEHDPR